MTSSRVSLGAAFLAGFLGLAAPLTARAERLEIPLPDLVGEWDPAYGSAEHGIQFTLPKRPIEVKWVELRLRGSAFPGAMLCQQWNADAEAYVPVTFPIPSYFSAYIPETTFEGWAGYSGPNPVGVFDRTIRFHNGDSWDLLRDGRGELFLYVDAADTWGACDPLLPPSKMEIDEAVLIVEGKFPKPKR